MTEERKPKYKVGDEVFFNAGFNEKNYFDSIERFIIKEVYFRCSSFDNDYQVFSEKALEKDKKRLAKSYSQLEYKIDVRYDVGDGSFYGGYGLFTKSEVKEKFNKWLGEGA